MSARSHAPSAMASITASRVPVTTVASMPTARRLVAICSAALVRTEEMGVCIGDDVQLQILDQAVFAEARELGGAGEVRPAASLRSCRARSGL